MIRHEPFGYWDNAGFWHSVVQVWALIPGTGCWSIIASCEVEVDPADVPARPPRPA